MVNMNIVPNDILSVAKLFKRQISHTTHWSHQNQVSHALKQRKISVLLLLFQNHVSYVSWVCGIVLTNHVFTKVCDMFQEWVAHVSKACFNNPRSWMDEWCSCLWNASANVEAKHLGCYSHLMMIIRKL